MAVQKEIGNNFSHENIREYLWKTLRSGQVVPGYVPTSSQPSSPAFFPATATVFYVTPILGSLPFKNSARRVPNSKQVP